MCCQALDNWKGVIKGDMGGVKGFLFCKKGKRSGVTWQEGGCECEEGCSSAQEELGSSLLARVGEAGAGKQEGEPCERGSISNGEDGYM